MQLQIRSAHVSRWRLLISFLIQDLEQAKNLGRLTAQLSLAGGDPAELRILDGAEVPVLHFITPVDWVVPPPLKGYEWLP